VTASSITISFAISPAASSSIATRRMFRSTAPSRSAVQSSEAAVIFASSSGACAATASAIERV